MSRAGRRLFHYIKTIVSKKKTKTTKEIIIGVNNSNLIAVKKKALSTKFFTIAHVNVRSIRNKAHKSNWRLVLRGLMYVPSQKHG